MFLHISVHYIRVFTCRNEERQDQLIEDVCRNININSSTQNEDMAIIVLQSLEVRISLLLKLDWCMFMFVWFVF